MKKKTNRLFALLLSLCLAVSGGGLVAAAEEEYAVIVENSEGGSICLQNSEETASKTAKEGETVVFTVVPEAGFDWEELTARAANGTALDIEAGEDGTYFFIMPASPVSIAAVYTKAADGEAAGNETGEETDGSEGLRPNAGVVLAATDYYLRIDKYERYTYNMRTSGADGGTGTTFDDEGRIYVNSTDAYCVQPQVKLNSSYATAQDAVTYFNNLSTGNGQTIVTDLAMIKNFMYATEYTETARHALTQVMIWRWLGQWNLNNYANTNLHAIVDGQAQASLYAQCAQYIEKNRERYTGNGTVFTSVNNAAWQKVMVINALTETKGRLRIQKTSANPDISSGNAEYAFAGAVYGVYTDAACQNEVATLPLNESGVSEDSPLLPLGTYYIKEKTAPKGYRLDTKVYSVKVTGGTATPVTCRVEDVPLSAPAELLLYKQDAETGGAAQGAASFQGAQFTVNYYAVTAEALLGAKEVSKTAVLDALSSQTPTRSWVLQSDAEGKVRYLNTPTYFVSGHELYLNEEGVPAFPLGLVTIKEKEPPQGYLASNTTFVLCVNPNTNGTAAQISVLEESGSTAFPKEGVALKEQIIRGDLAFTKSTDEDGKDMTNIPFQITHDATGESHIIITDETGFASTSAEVTLHTNHTNRGKRSSDGIWFGDITAIDNSKGALPYGMYTLDELPCENNAGRDLLKGIKVEVNQNLETQYLGNLTNKEIGLKTRAWSSAAGARVMGNGEAEACVDTVTYSNLTVGRTYVLKTTVVDKETGEVIAAAETAFTPQANFGTVDIPFTVNAGALAGRVLVVYEELYDGGSLRAEHKDLQDEDQTLYVPDIQTSAADTATNSKVGAAKENAVIVDTVSYKGLAPGETYTVRGTLVLKSGEVLTQNETGTASATEAETLPKAAQEALTDAAGTPVTAETTFVAEAAQGTAEVAFSFDASLLSGKTVVVFEELYYEGVRFATHADLSNESQTLYYPEIRTSAADTVTGERLAAVSEKTTLQDTVSYSNLLVGEEYTLKGTLMDKATGEAVTINGKSVTAEAAFTPEAAAGSAALCFTFDAREVAGSTIVVFEELYHNGVRVSAHEDMEDEHQTVRLPKLSTTATDSETASHAAGAKETVSLTDTVAYTHLLPGREYTVSGKLMVKEDNTALLTGEGKEITAAVAFTPEAAAGTVVLTYTFNAALLAGKSVVVFEDLYYKDILVYSHADITDEAQTVYFPKIGTTATDKADGDKAVAAEKNVTIADAVAYEALAPHQSYTLVGTLYDRATGEAVTADGKPITAETVFTPEEADGTAAVSFTFNAEAMAGKTLVVFEKLYDTASGVEIARHEDIRDEGQSVAVTSVPAKPKTGDKRPLGFVILMLITSLGVGILSFGKQKRRCGR